ncbi:GntR family transcriptional regulator [Epidermidibacterium keratini]|uniref:GntR family transcriptional regulator n=1 Tax=Epidermidibacterium keratini TaxID=1891644 RepID=A0A7L4YP84_9ACTN|nr:GntR family transcriptional regulator [Epidermidibacterium keratini]QHC00842.1 GntR family transcriptional regulator [Epidermidibacterium keratini]
MTSTDESAEATQAASDRIAAEVRDDMLSGHLLPGAPLRDTALASSYGVSRNTVREAFRLLQSQGLTEHRRHKGTVVRRVSGDDVRDIYTVRRALELRAIEQINQASAEHLVAIERAVCAAEAARDAERWNDVGTASLRFHLALVGSLSSPTLDACIDSVLSRLRLAFAPMPDEGQFQAPWIERDRHINDLLQSGFATDARAALRVYLDDSENVVLGAVRRHIAT